MASVRLGRGALFFLLRSENGQGCIALAHSDEDASDVVFIRCSFVGLRTVLSGMEYAAAEKGRQCFVKKSGSQIEFHWQVGEKFQAVVRVQAREYEAALDRMSRPLRRAA